MGNHPDDRSEPRSFKRDDVSKYSPLWPIICQSSGISQREEASAAPQAPLNTTFVQIGFSPDLNFTYVTANGLIAFGICDILPWGLAYGLGIGRSQVNVTELISYSPPDLNYTGTLAGIYIPSDSVTNLTTSIPNRGSLMYRNPNSTRAELMASVNPYIPVLAGAAVIGTGATSSSSMSTVPLSTGSPTSAVDSRASGSSTPVAPATDQTSLRPGAIVAIVMGSIVVLGMIAGLRIFFAFRKRRQAAKVSTSVAVKDSLDSAKACELDDSQIYEKHDAYGDVRPEKDGNSRSEVPAGGADQEFILEMPDTSRRSLRESLQAKDRESADV